MAASSAGPLAPLRAVLDSFWICRVSVFSVLSGWLLLYAAPQVQALFFDLHTDAVGLRHWAGFYVSVLLFWMLPTQLSARVMLHAGQDRFEEGHTRWYGILIVHLPWMLALACLVGIGAGQLWAFAHIPDDFASPGMEFEKVAHDQLTLLLVTTICLTVLWVLAWFVLPPLINRLTARSGLLDVRLFRFIAAIMFGRRGVAPLTPAEASEGDSPGRFAPEQLQTAWAAITLFLIWVLSIYLVFLSPLEANAWIDRAPMIPIVVGAWVPVLTFFVYGAHRFRLPILAAFVMAMTLLGNVLPGLHDMRVLRQGSDSVPIQARQPTLDQALQWWRKANGCGPTLSIDLCPVRPIIVAAEGGASRAAFFTGSLLAHLDDLSSSATGGPQFARQLFAISTVSGSSLGAAVYAARLEEAGGAAWRPLDREVVDNVLWYKSAKDRGLRGLTSVPLPAAPTRKDIVQQILAGDFLSPAAAALSLDFWVPFHARYWNPGDRTYFLEKSWEMRYADPSGDPRRKPGASGLERPLSSLAPEDGKWRPLLLFNGTSITTGRRIMTSTLHPLFLSPDDGDNAPPDQRTVEAVFRDAYDTYDLMCLPPENPTTEACSCTRPANKSTLEPLRIKNCDLRLSTAVSNSARFPLVSSHGDINSAANKLVDRIVDGGYFDYSGIVSAMELHAQIARIDNKLSPYVLFLTNDPGFNPQACKATDPNAPPTDELDVLRRPAAAASTPIRWQIFSSLAYPFDTLINARVARSEQAMAQSVLLNRYQNVKAGFDVSPKNLGDLRAGLQPYVSFDIVSVGARCNKEKQVQPIPMNWWLAMPTQAYLDQEMCAPHNRGSLAGVLSQLGPQPPPKPEAVHRERYERAKQRVDEACGATGVLPAASGRQTR
jgi:hypothetical protein